jgi:hypothetical protein
MSAKQDRQGVRTAKDLEQKYNFGQSFSEVQKSIKVATNTAEQAEKVARNAQTEILQLSNSISLTVTNGESTAQIKLKVGDKEIPATIDMKGLVTFSNLANADGTTVINGSNILTGQILADLIKAGVIKSKDGEKIVIDLDNGNVHAVGTFETEWESTDGSSVHTAVSPSGLHIQKGEGTGALHSKFLFHEAYVQKHNTDFTKAEAYMRPYGDPYDSGKSLMGLKHGDVASVENQVGETMLGTAYAQSVYSRGSKTLEVGVNDARTFISGLDAPQYNTDAVNKAYVDGNFAPAGYGLGEKCITVSSWDNATKNGFYHCDGWSGYVTAHAGGDISQECFGQMSGKMYKRFRWYCDGSWKEWEWVNPPLAPGVEYRTTERYQGRPVFVQCVNLTGQLPVAGATKFIEHGIANIDNPISYYGVFANTQAFVPSANFNGMMVTRTQVYVAPHPSSGITGPENFVVVIKYTKLGV